jgi:hypothetical protein
METRWHSYLSVTSTSQKLVLRENENIPKPKKCYFCETRKLTGTGNEVEIKKEKIVSGSLILFVIAFGFAHLLHQQILPFNDQSFPYKMLNEKQTCENEKEIVRFENVIAKTKDSKLSNLGNDL